MKCLYAFNRMIPVLCIVFSYFVFAQLPETMSYQGVLYDNTNKPVMNQTVEIHFSIWNDSVSTDLVNRLWDALMNVTTNKNGVFDTIFDLSTADDLEFNEQYWLEIHITSRNNPFPRIQLTASPYSLNARQVRGINKIPARGDVSIGTAHSPANFEVHGTISGNAFHFPGGSEGQVLTSDGEGNAVWAEASVDPAPNSVTSTEITDGCITSADIGANAVTKKQIATDAVGSDEIAAGSVGTDELAMNAVTTTQIVNGSITSADIGYEMLRSKFDAICQNMGYVG